MDDTVQLLEDAADAIADWINGAPCTDAAYARSLVNRLSTLGGVTRDPS
jgi:hypothetical protein